MEETNSLPLMGIGNSALRIDPARHLDLITPHGDWKRARGSGAGSGGNSHYPSWGLETAWRQPAGEGTAGSLPLMGIGNASMPRFSRPLTSTHYPSWGLETGYVAPGDRELPRLITPHGDWKPQQRRASLSLMRSHYPSWGLETRPGDGKLLGCDTSHYPSWGLETSPEP